MKRILIRFSVFISGLLQTIKRLREKKRINRFLFQETARMAQMPAVTAVKSGTLIVKCDDIGDFMAWQHVMPHFREHAERPLVFVFNAAVKPLVETWFDYGDQYIWVDKSRWENAAYRDSVYADVRSCHVRTAVSTLFTRNLRLDDMILTASSAQRRIAWDIRMHAYFPHIRLPEGICTEQVFSKEPVLLEYFRNMELAEYVLGIQIPRQIKPLFPDFSKQNRLLIFPVANIRSKNWNSKGWAQLIQALSAEFSSILLLGGKNAVQTASEIELMAQEPKLVNLTGQTSLTELMAFIGESRLLLCPDTAALHFAVQTATDVLVLSNGNNWQRFTAYAPYVKSQCVTLFPPHFRPDPLKMKTHYSSLELQSLPASDVIAAVRSMLSGQKELPQEA